MDIQKLTIVVDDQLIMVDGFGINMPLNLSDEIHAIQWQNGKGEIEFRDGRLNETFTDLTPYKKLIEEHARKKAEAIKPPEPLTGEELAKYKKRWRNSEITAVSKRLDQYRNDVFFGGDTFPYAVNGDKAKAAAMLNKYRIALVGWTDVKAFEATEPPKAPEFWTPAAFWWE